MATITDFDVVIAGASFGGCAAALAAAADSKTKVVLLEPSDWVGGQATVQGVTRWDEAAAALTESTGSPKSYRDVRHLIRAHYDGKRSAMGQKQQFFNPGFAGVGPPFATSGHPFAADPQVTRGVLTSLLKQAGVAVKFGATVTAVDAHDGAVHGFTVGADTYVGTVYVDATDLGDLLPLCGVKWVIGAESRADTGEADAEDDARPEWIQPITVPVALEWGSADHTPIDKPDNYDEIRKRQGFDRLKAPPPHGGEGDISLVYNPAALGDTLWNYRQFIDPRNFNDNRNGRTTMNVGSNDYLTAAIPSDPPDPAKDAQIVEDARAVSVAYVYYLQNDVPRDDHRGNGYKNIIVDTNAFGTADGTAPAAYIRESRRLANPLVRVVQGDIAKTGARNLRAKNFPDSAGIGWYPADVHQGWYAPDDNEANAETPNIGTRWHDTPTVPFQVPLGSLLPKELNNFVAACKNIGATHLTSGAYRVHPVEWAIGEAAGELAAYCVAQGVAPGAVWGDAGRVTAYQSRLLARGTPIFWWDDVTFEADARAFAAIQLLGARGTFEGDGTSRNFNPGGDFPKASRDAIDSELNHKFDWGTDPLTRADAAVLICEQLGLPI